MSNEALSLLKLSLDHTLYEQYKNLFLDEFFPKPVDRLWNVIKEGHEAYKRDITEDEVLALVKAKNGTMTTAMYNNLGELLEEVKQLPTIGNDVALEVLKAAHKSNLGRAIIEESYSLIEGREFDSSKVQVYIDQINGAVVSSEDELEFVPTDVEELLAQFSEGPSWKFNIEGLQHDTGGLQPGTFTLIFARPEVGKSLTAISLACGPEGWCEQGAKVLFVYNEELAKRQMLRAMSCNTGLIADQIREDPKGVNKEFAAIRDNIAMVDGVGWTTKNVIDYCNKYKPDIVILDQLDKFKDYPELEGHARLRQLYVDTREIGKMCGCAIVAISQASVDAQDKLHMDYSMLEGSKTGKAAECDLIIGIGSNGIINQNANEENLRMLNLCKNKLSGKHTTIAVVVHPQISRMEDINKNQRK